MLITLKVYNNRLDEHSPLKAAEAGKISKYSEWTDLMIRASFKGRYYGSFMGATVMLQECLLFKYLLASGSLAVHLCQVFPLTFSTQYYRANKRSNILA